MEKRAPRKSRCQPVVVVVDGVGRKAAHAAMAAWYVELGIVVVVVDVLPFGAPKVVGNVTPCSFRQLR
jgi:dienelactone hydrolase